MSNYVSKENAIGLKEIGFEEPLCAYYDGEDFYYSDFPMYNNADDDFPSAPDLLTAADYMQMAHEVKITFEPTETHVVDWKEKYDLPEVMRFTKPDHRNTALSHAIQIVKNRKK